MLRLAQRCHLIFATYRSVCFSCACGSVYTKPHVMTAKIHPRSIFYSCYTLQRITKIKILVRKNFDSTQPRHLCDTSHQSVRNMHVRYKVTASYLTLRWLFISQRNDRFTPADWTPMRWPNLTQYTNGGKFTRDPITLV